VGQEAVVVRGEGRGGREGEGGLPCTRNSCLLVAAWSLPPLSLSSVSK
jgi:hypothetical protein